MSLHCHTAVAKQRTIALKVVLAVRIVMVKDEVDIVACDFTGASWRRSQHQNSRLSVSHDSSLLGFCCDPKRMY